MIDLRHIPEFDMLQFINRQAQLMYVYGGMELQLIEYRKKNPDKNVEEAENKITILKDHLEFIKRLQREYETVSRLNLDYLRVNLQLTNEVEQLNKKVDSLTKQLNGI